MCLPTDYHSVNSLALQDCDCNSSETAYMCTICACLFYVGHVRVYSSLEAVGWRWIRWYVIMVITGLFCMFVFYKITLASLYTYLSVYCYTRLPTYHDGCFHRPTHDNMQRSQRKRWKEIQNADGNKTDQTPSRPHPCTKRLEQQYLLYTMNQQPQNHCIKTANTTRGGYLNAIYWPILCLSLCI